MHSFQWIQAALGVITGLGMTRIIGALSQMFVARHQVRLDWVPFGWAACIFLLLLQFSWGFVLLDGRVPAWRFGVFLLLLVFVLSLFMAAALILPASEAQAGPDLRLWYERHGRFAMPFVTAYVLLAYPFNWYFFAEGPLGNPASALLASLAVTAFATKRRRVLSVATALALLVTCGIVVEMVLVA